MRTLPLHALQLLQQEANHVEDGKEEAPVPCQGHPMLPCNSGVGSGLVGFYAAVQGSVSTMELFAARTSSYRGSW
eukprot:2115799-Amphidinium_carterae.1